MIGRLYLLKVALMSRGLLGESEQINCLIKSCSMPGVDAPHEEVDIEGVDNAIDYIKENKGLFIYLDNPAGTKKRFGQKNLLKMPFHYGEFTEINNPSDDMGWDVVIVPSAEREASISPVPHVPANHDLTPVGYIPVNDSQEEWTERTKSDALPDGKPAPIGNDKIILAPNGDFTDEDKRIINNFFDKLWNFKEVVWFRD